MEDRFRANSSSFDDDRVFFLFHACPTPPEGELAPKGEAGFFWFRFLSRGIVDDQRENLVLCVFLYSLQYVTVHVLSEIFVHN